ncbi:MAG: hypothetical protein ACI3VN_05310 [Candidatus Onthomonas sp.]
MEDALRSAHQQLTAALEALGIPSPERIPLRLRERDGLVLSALARQVSSGSGADRLARALAEAVPLDGSPFDRVEAREGLLLLYFSQNWYRQVLAYWNTLPLPAAAPLPTPGRRDGRDRRFLLDYTLRRCSRPLPETEQPLPGELVCLLARGPGAQPERWAEQIARLYWHLSPALRRDGALAGATARAIGHILA